MRRPRFRSKRSSFLGRARKWWNVSVNDIHVSRNGTSLAVHDAVDFLVDHLRDYLLFDGYSLSLVTLFLISIITLFLSLLACLVF